MKRALISLVVALFCIGGLFAQTDSSVLLRSHGSLTSEDGSYDGNTVDWYDIEVPADGRIEAVAVSVDGPLSILLRRNSQSVEEFPGNRGVARTTRSVFYGERLSIGVAMDDDDNRVWSGPAEYTVQVVFATGDTALAIGGYVTGYLESSDEQHDGGSYIDWYPLPVVSGIRIRVDVASDDFDTYLIVEPPGGGRIEDDDTNGTNSSVGFTAVSDGIAQVGVRAYGSGNTGEYEVRVIEERVGLMEVGQVIVEDLTAGSAIYSVHGTPGQVVDVDLSSYVLDTTLTIEDADGYYGYSDDYGNSTDSHLVYVFGDRGVATITVGSYGGSGEYTLSVQESAVRYETLTDGYRLEDGDVIAGNLTYDSPQVDGKYSQRFTFYAEANERVEIMLQSDSFDSYLRLVDPRGFEYTDDDSAGNLDSLISLTTESAGIHEVYATPLSPGDFGLYTISYSRTSMGDLILSTRGQLTPNDASDIGGKRYDTYQFRAQAGRTVVIDVVSMAFDTQAILRDQNGAVILSDDDGGSDSNSRIEFIPDRSATFELVVTSFSADSYGNYTVTIYE